LLYPYLRAPARFAGIDREARWVAEAPQHFRRALPEVPAELLSFAQGDATCLPLPDNSFDVVTCQTVLMHLARPLDALREMWRVLRPGGLLVCVEPNNFWNYLPITSLTSDEPIETLVQRFEFWLRYHRGRSAAGLGNESIGELVPGYFAQLELIGITVHQSDKTSALFPPYNTPGQQALLRQEEEWKKSAAGPWDREAIRSHVRQGGGTEELLERGLDDMVRKFEDERRAMAAGTFHAAYGALSYLVSGRKK
jgi:SAM-dependent methyltransferase